jgi:hypothetical protein
MLHGQTKRPKLAQGPFQIEVVDPGGLNHINIPLTGRTDYLAANTFLKVLPN